MKKTVLGVALAGAAWLSACQSPETFEQDSPNPAAARVGVQGKLKNYSVTPSLIKNLPGFENLSLTTLISSDDTLPQSPKRIYGRSRTVRVWSRLPDGTNWRVFLQATGGQERTFSID